MKKNEYKTKQYSTQELLEIFPEAKKIIPEKVFEWQKEYDELAMEIKLSLSKVSKKDQWFYDIAFEKLVIPKLLEIENHIFRLKRYISIIQGLIKNPNHWENFQEMIDIAKVYPIYELARDKLILRPSGKNFVALCPFHNEKKPSCYFYTETNTFVCFGCGEKGDVIKLTMQFYGVGFKDAVKMLQ